MIGYLLGFFIILKFTLKLEIGLIIGSFWFNGHPFLRRFEEIPYSQQMPTTYLRKNQNMLIIAFYNIHKFYINFKT